ncbi:DUF1176 domain-containing protein [Martelella sp. HB161492]|uniref:DUF1176 domain-containing protein n=1 Tax=Martelella sp. HB161492 TaxID=2720726 RepID=UPI001590F474|nr:DUF1176 domain-containing protein [Martelella sp. HB161492]
MMMRAELYAAAALLLTAMPAIAADADLGQARAMVMAALPDDCDATLAGRLEGISNETYAVTWGEQDYDGTPLQRHGTLFAIPCSLGAYNLGYAYVFAPEDDFLPMAIVSFATPDFVLEYADDTDTTLSRDPVVTGFASEMLLVNPRFDPETNTITSFSKWRGLGDAWDSGEWTIDRGRFVLKRYVIDPIYEANLEAPQTIESQQEFVLFQAEVHRRNGAHQRR